jgi:hypothetical protein
LQGGKPWPEHNLRLHQTAGEMVAREWKVSMLPMRHCGESEKEARSRNTALYAMIAIKSMEGKPDVQARGMWGTESRACLKLPGGGEPMASGHHPNSRHSALCGRKGKIPPKSAFQCK